MASASQGCGFCSLVVGISDLRSRLISLPKLATDILYLELDGPGRLKAHTSGTSLWGRLKYCPAASEDSCKRLSSVTLRKSLMLTLSDLISCGDKTRRFPSSQHMARDLCGRAFLRSR